MSIKPECGDTEFDRGLSRGWDLALEADAATQIAGAAWSWFEAFNRVGFTRPEAVELVKMMLVAQ